MELASLRSSLGFPKSNTLDCIPDSISNYKYWNYGTGEHSSEKRLILDSVNLQCKSDQNRSIGIRHIVVQGSSQWDIGRNITRACNHLQINHNRLQLPVFEDFNQDSIKTVDSDTHSYVLLNRFTGSVPKYITASSYLLTLTSNYASINGNEITTPSRTLKEVRHIVRRIHEHVCGHAKYGDMKILLQRNKLWSNDTQKLLSSTK